MSSYDLCRWCHRLGELWMMTMSVSKHLAVAEITMWSAHWPFVAILLQYPTQSSSSSWKSTLPSSPCKNMEIWKEWNQFKKQNSLFRSHEPLIDIPFATVSCSQCLFHLKVNKHNDPVTWSFLHGMLIWMISDLVLSFCYIWCAHVGGLVPQEIFLPSCTLFLLILRIMLFQLCKHMPYKIW